MQLYKDFYSIMKQHSMLLSCTYEMRGAYSVLVIQLQLFFNVRTYIYCPWTPFRCCLVSPLSVSPWTSPICSMQCNAECMTVISFEKYQSQVVHSSICQVLLWNYLFIFICRTTYCNWIELKLIIKRHGKRPSCLHYVETDKHPCFGIASKCYISHVSSFSF